MVWQRAGTVAVQNGSTTVTGAGVDFAASSRVGDSFIGPDGATYEVANVASSTVISILPAYKGPTVTGAAYAIMPVQGYDKMLSDAFNSLNNQFGPKLAALGTTGNYDVLPQDKGGTGVADGRPKFTSISLSSVLYGISLAQGAYMGWNSGEVSGFSGEFNFLCNKGGGTGGFTWRSINADNSATGPAMTYSYGGLLTVPSLAIGTALPIASGGTGATSQESARTSLGLGSTDAPTLAGLELSGAGYIDFHYQSSSADHTTRIIPDSSTNITVRSASSAGLSMGASFFPNADGGMNCGTSSNRFASVYAITGTIQTSDAREKTAVTPMAGAEIAAAMLLAREIGTYKWLTAIQEKGADARLHAGFTVQRAIEIMEGCGLEALKYAFICHDVWPAIERETKEVVLGTIYSVGEIIYVNEPYSTFKQYEGIPSFTWEETSRVVEVVQEGREAGDRYGFRYDQLAMFIARGQEERISRLEALTSATA